ncbi:SEFIR domain-containing protein [Shewanella colwelliana]|uniref:SEFIR domain-containing protein n=1 Tax=Shewanella colwelliana TaxID=23 RepID=UPI0037366CE0
MAEAELKQPKVFISYSWSSTHHQEMVKLWADRLIHDGVDVMLDIYDLNEGDDKYAFMESMVSDEDVTHVLVVCDSKYKERADAREKGVGTESTIISSEVYSQVKQSKFIPILCEFGDNGEPVAPVFMNARIGINFSTPEAANENWEQLTRLLYGKPLHVKPKKGSVPSYITSDMPLPANEARAKFESLKQAVLQEKKGLRMFREDFLDAVLSYADEVRIKERPSPDNFGNKVLEDCGKLKVVRNQICDWVLLEASSTIEDELAEEIIGLLEKLRELKTKPNDLNVWNNNWGDALAVFVYETFLYIVAALLKARCFQTLHEIFTSSYVAPIERVQRGVELETFSDLYGNADSLQDVLRPGEKLYSPSAELIKIQADRSDISFKDLIQAETLTFMMAILQEDYWYPGTLHYAEHYEKLPFFLRAAQHKNFIKLATITGIADASELSNKLKEQLGKMQFNSRSFYRSNFELLMNLDNLDTVK